MQPLGDRHRSAAGYDRLARVYPWLERLMFGGGLERARQTAANRLADYLDENRSPRIVVLGDGRAGLAKYFVAKLPDAEVTVVDHSVGMLRRSADLGDAIVRVHGDMRTFDVRGFDVLALPFSMDCLTESEMHDCVDRWRGSLRGDAVVLWLDFVRGGDGSMVDGRLRRCWSALRLWLMHRFFRVATAHPTTHLVDMPAIFAGHGFTLVKSTPVKSTPVKDSLDDRCLCDAMVRVAIYAVSCSDSATI